MKNKLLRPLALLLVLTLAIFLCMSAANGIQTDHGRTDVEGVAIRYTGMDGSEQTITGKLYVPDTATGEDPAPAVLLLHGYQNDKETNAAYGIELSRRGYVVLSIDEYGHGSSTEGMLARGYTDHKVTVNYGEDDENSFQIIGGAERYRLMMNFSNQSFFNEKYSSGTDGSRVRDSSMGGIIAWEWLSEQPFVLSNAMAVSGHSMGTWAAWSVSAAYSGTDIAPRATILQCGELFAGAACSERAPEFNNVLLLQAKYDEFNYFRDYKDIVSDALLKSDLRCEFLGCTADEAAWNTTYGYFAEGTARRIQLINTNHRLTTHDRRAVTAAIDWYGSCLGHPSAMPDNDLVYWGKECLVLLAALCAIVSVLPVMHLVTAIPFLSSVRQPLPDRPVKSKKKWWRGTVITMLLAFATYPFCTQLGHGLFPLPEKIFRMTIGSGFWTWYLILVLIMAGTTIAAWKKSRKAGTPLDWYDLGLSSPEKAAKIDWLLLLKSAITVTVMIGWMYLLCTLCTKLFMLDFRFIWPFFKPFSPERLGQFYVYIPMFALFFLLNNAKIFGQSRVAEASKPGVGAFLSCWWRYALCMVGGIILVALLEYIPFFMDIAPGADLLFGTTFGGPFMSLLIVFIPQVLIFSLLCTYLNRKTGHVYVSALTVACMACWIVTGGSAIL